MSDKTEANPNAWFLQCIKEGIVGADEESWARDQLPSWMGQYDSYNGLEDVAWIVMKAVREALDKAAQVAEESNLMEDDVGQVIRALGASCEHEPTEKMSATICRKCRIVLREK